MEMMMIVTIMMSSSSSSRLVTAFRTSTVTKLPQRTFGIVNNKSNVPISTKTIFNRLAMSDIRTSSDANTVTVSSNADSIIWTTEHVRSTFIDYFSSRQSHLYHPSSACVPLSDPTLLFTNAGMNQFKPIFLGQIDPASPMAQFRRVVNSQKCIRAGGKHNDLEDVGRDTYHHTFFEMLGTWSFGDYFKQDAIHFAWDLLTTVYQLDPNRIYATYFEGDILNNIPADTEARDYWLQYLPAERVLACTAKDNFWEMGDSGPCGPCTEIHYDRIGGGRDAAALVNADDPDVIEIWNIVFIQYNRMNPTTLMPLPAQHVDTGMGLERLVSILQNKNSNYDIDCFQPLFEKIATMTDQGPYTGLVGVDDTTLKDTAYRAIADHARTLSFAIADGAVPSNEGRGYVLRRILRRATRYGQQILNCPPGFFALLVPIVIDTFGKTYPELVSAKDTIIEIIQEEEMAFSTMLQRGIKYFNELQTELSDSKLVSGEQAFFMYDTLGFPIDLTELMAQEAGLIVDSTSFQLEMEKQKERSRAAQRAAKNMNANMANMELIAEQTAALSNQMGILPTDDSFKYKSINEVDGTKNIVLPATILAIFDGQQFLNPTDSVQPGDYVGIILDKSSFYAEAGGQESDTGVIDLMDHNNVVIGQFDVADVQVYGGYVLHKGVIVAADDDSTATNLRVGQIVNCRVDYDRRRLIAPNHSMSHVLNAALRQVLGDKVEQRGSLCNTEKLRFDFSYKQAMTIAEIQKVEELCQQVVKSAQPVTSQYLPLDDAMKIEGVRAVFGEVYPDPVRVVSVGSDTSIEFCGGTHIMNTADAEAFVLVEETAVAKGIRRISAVTKDAARIATQTGHEFEAKVTDLEQLPADTTDLDKFAGSFRKDLDAAFISAPIKIKLRARIEGIQKKANDASKKALQQRIDICLNSVKQIVRDSVDANTRQLVLSVDIGTDAKAAQSVINTVKNLAPDIAFMGISEEIPGSGGKIMAFASVPDSMISEKGLKADDWVRVTLESCNGRGGGKPSNAQGQAMECNDVAAVIENATKFAISKVQ
jgi:alanyl-tRNA synthetase